MDITRTFLIFDIIRVINQGDRTKIPLKSLSLQNEYL